MNCISCGVSHTEKMLHRTKPTGQNDPGWMCMSCLDVEEPELANNIKSDDYPVRRGFDIRCANNYIIAPGSTTIRVGELATLKVLEDNPICYLPTDIADFVGISNGTVKS